MTADRPDHVFDFPDWLDIYTLSHFSSEVHETEKNGWVSFRTGEQRFMSPTAMIFLVKTCRGCRRMSGVEKITYRGLANHGYANNLGFSQALKIVGDPYPQNAFGGTNYIPLSRMTRADVDQLAIDEMIEFGDAIERRCSQISRVVSQGLSEQLSETLTRSFREIFRNTFEHSEAPSAVYCAQHWPTRNLVEICISDAGIGISKSLMENKYLKVESDKQALFLSLMPGISSKAWLHKKKKSSQRSEWDNSGYGLFFAHKLFGAFGEFFIGSGDTGVHFIRGGAAVERRLKVHGTIVSMKLDLSNPERIEKALTSIKNEAHEIKQRIGTRSVNFESVEQYLSTPSAL